MNELMVPQGFNFWSRLSDYRPRFSVQDILGMSQDVESTGGCHTSNSCTSDQGGSQDGGGGDCNSCGDA